MDRLSRAYYESAFEREFLKRKGTSFQDFFSEIMEKCNPSDFQRVRPTGRMGDGKNDGYLKSEQRVFQVYAPKNMSTKQTVRKIDEDFSGALSGWDGYIARWTFVHNCRDGLGPDVLTKNVRTCRILYTHSD
ncbi:MAG: hypothetical protein ACYCVB_09650 [Bacilli bacterium]